MDLSGTLGTLLRNTLEQVGAVKDVVERQARTSLEQLDSVMLERQKRDALANLGELIWDLTRTGRMPADLRQLSEDRDFSALIDELDDIHARIADERDRDARNPPRPDHRGQQREAHIERRPAAREVSDGTVSSAGWRPPPPSGAGDEHGQRRHEVRVWRPTRPSAPRDDHSATPTTAAAPPTAAMTEATAATPPAAADTPRAHRRRSRAHDGARGGGIAFVSDAADEGPRARGGAHGGGIAFVSDVADDDDDLSEYMHEDDLPTGYRRGAIDLPLDSE
ncbi:MAG: hypothetical protein Tsb0020_05700 [Haliangiales bacterium]